MNTYIERNTVFQTNHLLTTKRDDKDLEMSCFVGYLDIISKTCY